MIRITIDDEQKKKLLDANGIVELCDETGHVVRRLLPELNQAPNGSTFNDEKQLTPDITSEEYQRLRDSDNWEGMSTSEAINALRNRS